MLENYLNYAKRVALCMSRDPEMESLAGLAAWKAYRTFDPKLNIPWERWVAFLTRQHVYQYWRDLRRRREVQMSQMDALEDEYQFCDTVTAPVESHPIGIEQEDWELLVESYIDQWPLDVIAKRRGWRYHEARFKVFNARVRLSKHVQSEKSELMA